MNGHLSNLSANLTDRVRDAADRTRSAGALLEDDGISTVMGRVATSGRLDESETLRVLNDDSTLEALLRDMDDSKQQAIKARLAQIGALMTATASKTAIDTATSEIKTQLTQPAMQEIKEAIASVNVCGQAGSLLATKATQAAGGMHKERAEAIAEHTKLT